MKTYPILGIIGGVGPYAGIDMATKVMANTLAIKDQDHIPLILASLPHEIPGRPEFLTQKQPINPGKGMAKVALILEKSGVTHCAVPCNTAHAPLIWQNMLEHLQKNNSQLIFIHILEEVLTYIEKNLPLKNPKIGILATDGTIKSGLYQNYFTNKAQLLFPSEETQNQLTTSIFNPNFGIKAFSNPISEKALALLMPAVENLALQKADLIILACSEISFALKEKSYYNIPCIDPVNILARGLINATYPEKLKTI